MPNKFFSHKNRKLFLKTENKGKKQLPNIPYEFVWGYFSTQKVETQTGNPVIIYLFILLIRGFPCFIFIKIFSYKFWNNIPFSLIFFPIKKKKKKEAKIVILSHVQKGKEKKNRYSQHPFVFKCLIPIFICYLFKFKYFNYLYKKKKSKIFVIQILYSYYKSPSIHTNIYHLSFV